MLASSDDLQSWKGMLEQGKRLPENNATATIIETQTSYAINSTYNTTTTTTLNLSSPNSWPNLTYYSNSSPTSYFNNQFQMHLSATRSQAETQLQLLQQQIEQHENECQQLIHGSNVNCSSENIYDNIDFHPEEINFKDIQLLWTVKEPLNIFFRVSLIAPIILLGILGNLTIIYSMFKFKPFRTKPTNIFILNMAIADLLTTLVCPSAALFSYIYQFYVLGSFICRIEGFIKIKPCRKRITIEQSWLALLTIWVTSVVMASPLFFLRRLRHRQWKDLVEVWCCELIQYSKYYWVVINFFLIYLPTFFMTIVLVIILAQMDKFEAKLRRSRSSQSNASFTINMNYRRRIVKILFTYLLTSIICWTPLQVFIIYRHFRTQSKAASWFFELNFFTSLSASLTAATNPIIFGFLSQPFRKLVKKTLMFKFFDKILTTNSTAKNTQNRQPEVYMINNNNNNKQNNNCQSSPKTNHLSNNSNKSPANKLSRKQRSLVSSSNVKSGLNQTNQKQVFIKLTPTKKKTTGHNNSDQQQSNDNKRVSFFTIYEQEANGNHRQIASNSEAKGRINRGYVGDKQQENSPNINTTSFINNNNNENNPEPGIEIKQQQKELISGVSMDSINIEENLGNESLQQDEEEVV